MSNQDLTKAIYNLANVLENYGRRTSDSRNVVDVTMATCHLVANAEGFRFYVLPQNLYNKNSDNLIELIADYSHVKYRKIKLTRNWWKDSNSSIITYQLNEKGEKQIVAVIQNKSRKYEIHNLARGSVTLLTEESSLSLDKEGWVFYRYIAQSVIQIKSLLKFLGLDKKDFINLAFVTLLFTLVSMVLSLAIGDLVDSIIPSGEQVRLAWLSVFLLVFSVALFGLRLNQNFIISRIIYKIDAVIMPSLWSRILRMPISFFRQYLPGDLIIRIYSVLNIRSICISMLNNCFMIGTLFFYSVFIFYFMPYLVFVLLAFFFLYVFIGAFFSYVLTKNNYNIINMQARLSNSVLQYLKGIHKLKTTGTEARAYAKWADIYSEKEKISFKNSIFIGVLDSINHFFPTIMTLVFFVLTVKKFNNSFNMGLILVVFGVFLKAVDLIIDLANSFILLIESLYPELKRIKPILNTVPEVDKQKLFPGHLSGKIEINQVSFSYEGAKTDALSNVSFQIQPGEFVGITGFSGCGKSTLLRLMLGFEKPRMGAIYYDSHNLADIDITAVRRQIGVVLQNGQLLAGSIFQNIVGSLPYSMDDAWRVAQLCGLDKDILQMPMGMHTWVSEGGVNLSGGQRQLLLIARALIHNPKFLFFDEATSVLDNSVQNLIVDNLISLKVTRVVIAHRLSTLEKADRIIVLKEGKIVEVGHYKELIKGGGHFAQLAEHQRIII